ncbi:MAG TPA: AraC family transcriptional regulator ligand-binding domain-containing protein [Gemmatimonadales bacterium]|jgi:AraC-like DNA-binding protein
MTARANELTRRANSAPLMQPASQLRVFGDALGELGYDVASLLTQAGLRSSDLDDPDALVPCASVGTFLSAAAKQRRVPNLGAHLAFHTPLGAYPLLDYLVLTTDNVGDALRQLERYFHLATAPCRLDVIEEKQCVRLLLQDADPFVALYETAIVIHHLHEETQQRVPVFMVSLTFEPDDRRDLERLLKCPVRSPAPWSGIEFPREAMAVALRRRDPVLRSVLEGRATPLSPGPRAVQDTVAAQVRAAVASRIGDAPDIARIARQLAMGTRTLQRRLAAEGVSYKDLVDHARRDAAQRLLEDRSLAVAEVGYLLGFSEPSAFHRAFKRWCGVTPLEYRKSVV